MITIGARNCSAGDPVTAGTVSLACFAFHDFAERTKKTGKRVSIQCCDLESGGGRIGPVHSTDGSSARGQTQEREF